MSVVLVEMPAAPPLSPAAVANYAKLRTAIQTTVVAMTNDSPTAEVDVEFAMRSLNAHSFDETIALPPGTALHSLCVLRRARFYANLFKCDICSRSYVLQLLEAHNAKFKDN